MVYHDKILRGFKLVQIVEACLPIYINLLSSENFTMMYMKQFLAKASITYK